MGVVMEALASATRMTVTDAEKRRSWVYHQTQPMQRGQRFVSMACSPQGDGSHDCAWCQCPQDCHRIFAEAQGLLKRP